MFKQRICTIIVIAYLVLWTLHVLLTFTSAKYYHYVSKPLMLEVNKAER